MNTISYDGLSYAIPENHYSTDADEPMFFYGGVFSNMVGGPWQIMSSQPWAEHLYTADYETVEHFFAASKATTREAHDLIRSKRGPWSAKHAGRKTELRADWEEVKSEYMLTGLRAKFGGLRSECVPFRAALLSTGNRLICEDSPTDGIWGCRDKSGGYTGKNLLGIALMQVRDELRDIDGPLRAA